MNKKWWMDKVVYQIYPKSFYDTNHDGIGDLEGIRRKLPYLRDLGVDILWLCPVYRSPMDDNGYDISDYYSVDPQFGTDEDLFQLIREAGEMEIKIIMDLVINHCSDEHPWFQEALADPDSEEAGYFIFREGRNGQPPCNWRSVFGGNVWERVGDSNRYYFHTFGKKQPDFNWENPILRQRLYDMVNWWLDKGIAGFRVDAITHIKKHQDFRKLPPDDNDGLARVVKRGLNQPGIEVFLQELNEKTFRRHHCFTVAEAPGIPARELSKYIGDDGYFSTIFNFDLSLMSFTDDGNWFNSNPWTVTGFKRILFRQMRETGRLGWSSNFLENHDQPRSLNQYIPEKDIGYHSATMLAAMLMMLRGTPFIYQGQELGMTNCPMTIQEYDDLFSHSQYEAALAAGLSPDQALAAIFRWSRDNARTPFQWSSETNAGFTKGKPWLKINPNYLRVNAENQLADPRSVLSFYKRLVRLRKSTVYSETAVFGDFKPYPQPHKDVVAYTRDIGGGPGILVLCNYSPVPHKVKVKLRYRSLLMDNYEPTSHANDGVYELKPYQAMIFGDQQVLL